MRRKAFEPDAVRDAGMAVCVLARLGGCYGHMDLHHVAPKQHLTEAQMHDRRGVVWLCRHHHQQVEWKRVYLEPDDLPWGVETFLGEVGQAHRLVEVLGGRAA